MTIDNLPPTDFDLPVDISPDRLLIRNTSVMALEDRLGLSQSILGGISEGTLKYDLESPDAKATLKLEQTLRESALQPESIDSGVLESELRVKEFMKSVAITENLPSDSAREAIHYYYIPQEVWDREYDKRSAAYISSATRAIYIRYPTQINPNSLLNLTISQLHEARHLMTPPSYVFEVAIDEEELDTEDGRNYVITWGAPKFGLFHRLSSHLERVYGDVGSNFFSEMFTVAWTEENLDKVLDSVTSTSVEEKRALYASTHPNRPALITTIFNPESPTSFLRNEYSSIGDTYLILKQAIPDILNLLHNIGFGKRGYRRLFAQRVLISLGRDALIALGFAQMRTAENVYAVLQSISLAPQGKFRDFEYDNEGKPLLDPESIIQQNIEEIMYYNRHRETVLQTRMKNASITKPGSSVPPE